MTANHNFLRARFWTDRSLGTAALATYLAAACLAIACLAMMGCSSPSEGFDENKAMESGSGKSLAFESEQVSFSPETLNCAVDNGLFEAPEDTGSRPVARVTDKGRAIGFSDDVTVWEPENPLPYTQIRGTFPVEFKQVVSIRDIQLGAKRVEARAGVRIQHSCFGEPLALMGVRNGVIAEKNPAAFEFDQYGDDWRMVGVLH